MHGVQVLVTKIRHQSNKSEVPSNQISTGQSRGTEVQHTANTLPSECHERRTRCADGVLPFVTRLTFWSEAKVSCMRFF
jgi:hypothetical protein